MVGKGRIWSLFLISTVLMTAGCSRMQECRINDRFCTISLELYTEPVTSKAARPDEQKISDINIMVFDEYGDLEASKWIQADGYHGQEFKLIQGRRYTLCACANLGYRIYVPRLEEVKDIIYHLAYPDEYREGIPMSVVEEISIPEKEEAEIEMKMERLMSKISIRMDRSRLDEDIEMIVTGISIGNCPKKVRVFSESKAGSEEDCFIAGFNIHDEEIENLNTVENAHISKDVTLYMLENMQGRFAEENIYSDTEKVLSPHDPRYRTSSYIEISMQYVSKKMYSKRDLKYRFYLGEGKNDLDVERNCHYRITVCPNGDGLGDDSWRVDKTGLSRYIDSIELSEKHLELNYSGQSAILTVRTSPLESSGDIIFWHSSDPDVASVTQSGTVTAHSEGECTITCSSLDGGNAEAQCKVFVNFLPISFGFFPGNYIEGKVGDQIRIWCEYFPPNAVFDPGYEELEFDRQRGIYDYDVDTDDHSVTLTLLEKGSGIVYMSVGEPVNMTEMAVIYITE